MKPVELLEIWKDSPRLFSLADRLTFAQPQHILAKNLRGSASQFVAAAIFLHPTCSQLNHVFVCNDEEDAAYFHNTLENITEALNIFYFPSSFKNNKNYRLLNSSHVMLRTECLTKFSNPLSTGRVGAIVTYPEALFEKVVLSKTLSSNIISFKQGEIIDVDGILSRFVNHGFSRTDFVYEPGQFAVRGGILDIYSFGNEKPYRIELFGNDVDSIRIIDPETQLSERKLLQVSIIPNIDTQFRNVERVSLLEFLPSNTVIWMEDSGVCREKLITCEEDLQFFFGAGNTSGKRIANEEKPVEEKIISFDDFIKAYDFNISLETKHMVEFGHQSGFKSQSPTVNEFIIEFNTKDQPAFNRRFDLLINDFKSWEKKGFHLYLFAENPKQLERLHSIFEDLKAEIHFEPLATSIHEGFIDEDLKIVCYT